MPISRFVAVSFRPASSVLRRTFVRTGSERLETARLTTDRPRARFSCMTDSFNVGLTPRSGAGALSWAGSSRAGPWISVRIFPLSSHLVITVIMVWTALTAVLGPVRPAGGTVAPGGGSSGGFRGRAVGCDVDDRTGRDSEAPNPTEPS